MANCLIGLGSNLGDRGAHLQSALHHLANLPETKLVAQSSFRDTRPAGGPVQDPYLNAAATIETSLEPLILLRRLQLIEHTLGRVRSEHWGPRTIDLDLLLFDKVELNSPDLTVPHPRMSFRRFVLEPAAEIAAEMVYPINGWTVQKLTGHLQQAGRFIVLRSHDRSCEELLSSLADVSNVKISRYERKGTAGLRAFEIERRKERHAQLQSATAPDRHSVDRPWIIFDRYIEGTPCLNNEPVSSGTADVRIPPALVVVWQRAASNLESLDQFRRSPRGGPHLWIPGLSLEQARQEVIAAMAAME